MIWPVYECGSKVYKCTVMCPAKIQNLFKCASRTYLCSAEETPHTLLER